MGGWDKLSWGLRSQDVGSPCSPRRPVLDSSSTAEVESRLGWLQQHLSCFALSTLLSWGCRAERPSLYCQLEPRSCSLPPECHRPPLGPASTPGPAVTWPANLPSGFFLIHTSDA